MKHIPIFFTCDENYVPFLDVTLNSIKDNCSSNYIYDITIINSGMSETIKNSLKLLENDIININFLDINPYIKEIKNNLHTRDYYTCTTYYRLFIPRIYSDIDKCLYLDSDIVIKGDISELFNYDIEDKLIGGIPDEIVSNVKEFSDYTLYRLGIPCDKYVNAGVLVMNLKELRKFDFENKFMDMLNSVKFTVAQDQDYINYICKGRIKYIPSVWNKQPIPSTIDIQDIKLIHYNLHLKPWHYDDILYQEYFWDYAKKSSYFDLIMQDKENYTDEKRKSDDEKGENLKLMAKYEAEVLGEFVYNEK